MHVGFAGPEVTALDRVIEEAADAVAIVVVVLGGIDATLGCDGVGAAGAVLVAVALDLVAEFGEGGCRSATSQAGAHDDDLVLPLIGRVHELEVKAVLVPLLLDRAVWDSGIEFHGWLPGISGCSR